MVLKATFGGIDDGRRSSAKFRSPRKSCLSAILGEGTACFAREAEQRRRVVRRPCVELSKLKECMKGFKLAYHLMTEDLFNHAKILYLVTQPMWSWHARQVESVKTPNDGLTYLISLSFDRHRVGFAIVIGLIHVDMLGCLSVGCCRIFIVHLLRGDVIKFFLFIMDRRIPQW